MAYPNTTKKFTDTLARDHFIEAIDDQTLRMKLREAEPITLSEATQIATRFEAYKTAEFRRKQSIHVSAGQTESNHFKNNSEHIAKPNNSNCTFNNDDAKSGIETVTQLTKTLEKLADAFEKLSKDKHETNQRNRKLQRQIFNTISWYLWKTKSSKSPTTTKFPTGRYI
ncbi:hypothetical protein DPMN_131724 [Dreissena polymorpha]|uniref:Uncharacterized protein n=1 Tax=Dreissena polymorpha TaxID=45954 RepID=A0A9D4JCH4_DREPO|nr:hypothetical protein DPMN_131724 [Dreissena polymorpha]